MILSDRSLREAIAAGRIVVEPYDDSMVQPSSIDVRLDRYFRVFLNHTMPVIDVKKDLEELTRLVEIDDDQPFVLHPGEFVLGSTYERVALPDDHVGRVEGKSSLGRLGLLIHSSLPGYEPVVVRRDGQIQQTTIGQLVQEKTKCEVVAFDPETTEVGYHHVTGFYEGPADKIFEVRLESGRRVRVTAGHNLFARSATGKPSKVRTAELAAGVEIAVSSSQELDRLVDGGLAWDRVVEVVDTGEWERIYDIEVRPGGRKIENFLAGHGGVFVSNTAGFIDAGFDGHITLELSNVANLPITLYPGMKIGQISFLEMTTPADAPYGSSQLGSKYQGQRGPTPSRYWENFAATDEEPSGE